MYQGKYREAVERNQTLLELSRRVRGADHPETLTVMHNLATGYHVLGDDARAVPIATDVVERRGRVLGPEHLLTLSSMDQLALEYSGLNRNRQAEMLFRQVLDTEQRTLGPHHPERLTVMNHLAALYSKEGLYAQTETLQTEIAEATRQALGPEHRSTLLNQVNLAFTEHLLHQDAHAEDMLRGVLSVFQSRLADDWQRYRCESVLGETLAAQRKYAEAEPLLISGYQGLLQRKSKISSDSLVNLENAGQWLVAFYRETNRPAKAAEWQTRIRGGLDPRR
jgi:hypothetical protein